MSSATEWRVMTKTRPDVEPLVIDCRDEEYARATAVMEREEYPHADVWIEQREVSPWVKVEP